MSIEDRKKLEEATRQLALQLEELKNAIQVAQNRVVAISNEIEELRLAYETLSAVEKFQQNEALISLDRRGYAYLKTALSDIDRAIVYIGQDLYVSLPIEKAKSVLTAREKDMIAALREAEAELKKLTDLYNQLQRKLQDYITALGQSEKPRPSAG